MQLSSDPSQFSDDERTRVRGAMQEVLESEKFSTSPQMSAFLRYVVEETLEGNQKRIKAYTVAVDALGKPPTFDPQNDPVVRVLAGRLRASLKAHYENDPNANIHIQIKPGSYVPQFVDDIAIDKTTAEECSEITVSNESESGEAAIPTIASPLLRESPLRHTSDNSAYDGAARSNKPDRTYVRALGSRLLALVSDTPKLGFAVALMALGSAVVFITTANQPSAPSLAGATGDQFQANGAQTRRSRPEQIRIFIAPTDNASSFEEQLNTIISGVFLENTDLRVYRSLRGSTTSDYWPEDYLVSLDVVPMPSETLISVQIINAQTGQIRHSDRLSLSESANDTLTSQELTDFIEFARELVSRDGPIALDYRSSSAANTE